MLDLSPGRVYLCKGTLNQVRWLKLDLPTEVLVSPTTDEILSAVGFYTTYERAVIIVVEEFYTSTTKAKSKYAFPDDALIDINENTYVFVWGETDGTKAGNSKVDKFYGKLAGELFTVVDLSNVDYRQHPNIQYWYNSVPTEYGELIYEAYKYLPTALLNELKAYPDYTLPEGERDEVVVDLVSKLGSAEGVRRWFDVSGQEFGFLFLERIVLAREGSSRAISWFMKRLGVSSPGSKFPTGYSTRLAFYVSPFIKAANRSSKYFKEYLGLFAAWAYYAQRKGRAFYYFETRGKRFHVVNLGDAARLAWTNLTARLDKDRRR